MYRKLLIRNPSLRSLPRASLSPSPSRSSEYVVRTQPREGCLSTVEAVARALEDRQEEESSRADELLRPLRAMCNLQINHGEVKHDTRQFKRENAEFVKRNNFKRRQQ